MVSDFRKVSDKLKRAAEQRLAPLDEKVFSTVERVQGIQAPGIDPLLDPEFVTQTLVRCIEKINELVEGFNLLVDHNLLLEEKQNGVIRTLNKHTSEIADSLERIIDIEPKEEK